MTSRERVLKTFARQVPDRVPINYSANADIDWRLKQHYGLARNDGEGLRRALGVDFRGVDAPYIGPKLHPDLPDRNIDIWGIRTRWIAHESGGYWDYCDFPLRDATLEQIEAWPLPKPDHFDYSKIAEQCARHAGFAIHAGGPGTVDIINKDAMLRNMEQVLVDLLTDEPAGLRLIDRRLAVQLEVTARILEAGRGRIDFLWLGEDLGTQKGPLISLELFRKHIRPRHQKFVDLAKAWKIPVLIHSCGSSSWAFDDFAEMGIGAVDTLQPEAKNMAPAYLKQRYGGKLAFHGCISTAGPVAFGTPEQTAQNAREVLEVMMPGGGYCFAPTHMLQDNSPTENVLAMYETAHKWGKY
ncbi:MAG: uroporphyrinogen decarboxylase family protein [Planctomycetota bacterium]